MLCLLLKLPPRKLEHWFVLWSLFLLKLLFISINLSYGHAWNIDVMFGLVLQVATWNCRIWRAVGPSLAVSLELFAHLGNKASLNLFYRYYFGKCSSELVSFPYSRGRSTCCSDRLHDFSVTVPRCYKDVYVNVLCQKFGSIKYNKYWFCVFVDNSDWHLFQFIVILNPDFNY